MFTVTEAFVEGKHADADRCEDVILDGPDWIALCDGVTDKSGLRFDGRCGGLVVAELVARAVAAAPTGENPADLVARINDAYTSRLGQELELGGVPDGMRPACSVVALDKKAGRVVRVGDTTWVTHQRTEAGHMAIDDVHTAMRSAYLRMLILDGHDPKDLAVHDPSRDLILPGLKAQSVLRNNPDGGPLAHGVIDGRDVPDQFVEAWTLAGDETEIALASDGYPVVFMTHAATEDYLQGDLAADPLRIHAHPSTKPLAPGQASFDDRSYVRLTRPA
jgi:hypothetical protein